MCVHAGLVALFSVLTLARSNRAAGDPKEVVPNVTFGLVVPEPPEPLPPESVAPAAAAPVPPVAVVEPAPMLPVDPVVTTALSNPATVPTAAVPAPPVHTPAPASKPRRTIAAAPPLNRGERGGDARVTSALCTFRATPEFPTAARLARNQGTVIVVVVLDAAARIGDVRIAKSSGFPLLDAAAQSAARRCRFRPATRGGAPIASEVRVPYTFRLDR